jgi:nitrogen fixation/metabolism regulation signal transduction histidine kinase
MKPKCDIELKHINVSAVNLTLFVNFLADKFDSLITLSQLKFNVVFVLLLCMVIGGPIYSLSI